MGNITLGADSSQHFSNVDRQLTRARFDGAIDMTTEFKTDSGANWGGYISRAR